jgi:hypothetical protein
LWRTGVKPNVWERGALEHLREGRAADAIARYQQHDRVHVCPTGERAREQLVRDWAGVGDLDEAVMIARRRDDVADLNARARVWMREAGALGDTEARWPGGAFAVGDRVVVKLNDARLGVHNGDRGRVVSLGQGSITLQLRGRAVRLDAEFLMDRTAQGDPTLVYGYAITGHVAQGLTVDHAFVLADDGLSREWGYTAMSRGRRGNHLYVAAEPDDSRDEFAPADPYRQDAVVRLVIALGRSDETMLAIDAGDADVLVELRQARAAAQARLQQLEAKASRFWPGAERRVAAARAAEERAEARLAEGQRRRAERRHGSQPFVEPGQHEKQASAVRERIAERRARQDLGRGRGR